MARKPQPRKARNRQPGRTVARPVRDEATTVNPSGGTAVAEPESEAATPVTKAATAAAPGKTTARRTAASARIRRLHQLTAADYEYVKSDLIRIAIIAGAMLAILIVLALVLR